MLGMLLAVYPFVHGWYGLGSGAMAAEVCAIMGFRKMLRSDYSWYGAIIAGIVGFVVSIDALGRTAIGATGVERTLIVQFGLITVSWLCCTLSAFIGSLLNVRLVRRAESDHQRDSHA